LKVKVLLFVFSLTFMSTFSQKKWTLKECVDHAIENNITVQQSLLNLELAKLNVKNTKGNFLPNLNTSASQGFNFGSFLGIDGSRISRDTRGNTFSANSSTTLFNGFRNLNTYKQAKLGVDRSQLNLEKIQNDISLFVVNGYLNVLFAKENLNVAKTQAAISKTQVEAATQRYEAGITAKGDLLNAKSTAASDQQNVVSQENVLSIALLNLAQSLQIPPKGFDILNIEIDNPSGVLLFNNSEIVYQKALSTQPQIKNAKLGIINAEYNIEIAKSFLKPSINFSFGVNTSYQHLQGRKDEIMIKNPVTGISDTIPNGFFKQFSDKLGHNFSLNISIPIFNRTQSKTNIARQFINKELSQVNLDNEKLQLQQSIEQAFVDSKAAAKTFEASKVSLEAQREAFKNAQESYNLGTSTLFDFDLVRNRLVSAESALIRAKYDYVFKTKVLQFYAGELVLN
jgi:outer membrane protein